MFANRVAIVTGTSGGVGAAVAAAFAQAGFKVARWHDEGRLLQLAEDIVTSGRER